MAQLVKANRKSMFSKTGENIDRWTEERLETLACIILVNITRPILKLQIRLFWTYFFFFYYR